MTNDKRYWCTQCWSNNLVTDGKVVVAKGRKAIRYRCRDCGHRSFRRIDSYTDQRVLGNLLGFYKEGFALEEPYLSLIKALDVECQRKGSNSIEEWHAIVEKVLKEQNLAAPNQDSSSFNTGG